jgi:hypothetical protein
MDSAPVPPEVLTNPLPVRFESIAMFCDVLTAMVFTVRVKPVLKVKGTSYVPESDGISAATNARNAGVAAPPLVGPANTVFAL